MGWKGSNPWIFETQKAIILYVRPSCGSHDKGSNHWILKVENAIVVGGLVVAPQRIQQSSDTGVSDAIVVGGPVVGPTTKAAMLGSQILRMLSQLVAQLRAMLGR